MVLDCTVLYLIFNLESPHSKAFTPGRTDDHFIIILVDREFSVGCYLFIVSNSRLLSFQDAVTGFLNFTFTFQP